jgi:anti-sigma regulatory factor (Ser/Thr protein kinase)
VSPVDVELPPEASSAAAARAALRSLLLDASIQVDQQSLDRVLLLTSEVVTNAILHARTPMRLTAGVDGHQVVVRVYDGLPVVPRRRAYRQDAGTGRGMHLVEALADDWGVEQSAAGKCVWFAIAVNSSAPAEQYG